MPARAHRAARRARAANRSRPTSPLRRRSSLSGGPRVATTHEDSRRCFANSLGLIAGFCIFGAAALFRASTQSGRPDAVAAYAAAVDAWEKTYRADLANTAFNLSTPTGWSLLAADVSPDEQHDLGADVPSYEPLKCAAAASAPALPARMDAPTLLPCALRSKPRSPRPVPAFCPAPGATPIPVHLTGTRPAQIAAASSSSPRSSGTSMRLRA